MPKDITPYKGCLAPLIEKRMETDEGKPTDTRFSEDELLQRELSMSNMQYKLQYQLDATLSDIERYPLRCGDLMVIDIDRHLPEVVVYEKSRYLAIEDLPCVGMSHDPYFYRPNRVEGTIDVDDVPTVMALDPSGGGSDEFSWSVVKAWAGNYYVVSSGGHLGGVSEKLWRSLATLAKKYHVNEILVETNFGGLEIYAQLIKPYLVKVGAECRIEPIRSNQRKELRIIDTLAPVMQTHRLVFDRRVLEADADLVKNAKDDRDTSYSLVYQMTRLTHDRGSLLHDDRVDSLSMAIAWLRSRPRRTKGSRCEASTVSGLKLSLKTAWATCS